MKSENNGIYTYKGREYVLKYGHTVESARILLSAMERSGHLSDSMFYKMSKLMSRQGISVNDTIGMGNETICKISRIDGVGAACIDVLCELQRMGTCGNVSNETANQLIRDTYDEITRAENMGEAMEDRPFMPREIEEPREGADSMAYEETDKNTNRNELTITYGETCVRLSLNKGNVSIRISNGCIEIVQDQQP